MIRSERLTANLEGEFVVFLIGMRINNPLKVHKWLPVARAMPRMIKELYRQPELGFIHSEMWFSRTIILVQYWRSMGQLLAYAKSKNSEHLPPGKPSTSRSEPTARLESGTRRTRPRQEATKTSM